MIGYLTVGTNDLQRATLFYDALFAKMGGTRAYSKDRMTAWGFGEGKPLFAVTSPFDGSDASAGNGVMVALTVKNPAMVNNLHSMALEMGGQREGGPYLKGNHFYVGYVRDLDGNKLNFHCYV